MNALMKSCLRKRAYRSEAEAKTAIYGARLARPTEVLHPYRCPAGCGWHLGRGRRARR